MTASSSTGFSAPPWNGSTPAAAGPRGRVYGQGRRDAELELGGLVEGVHVGGLKNCEIELGADLAARGEDRIVDLDVAQDRRAAIARYLEVAKFDPMPGLETVVTG